MGQKFLRIWASARRAGRLMRRSLQYDLLSFLPAVRRRRTEALIGLYRGVNQWLARTGADYVLVYGTLLGWQREGTILAHDRDVDFGVPEESFRLLWEARRSLPAGFRIEDTSYRHGGPKLYVTARGWEADIYFFRRDGEQLRTCLRSDIPSDTIPFPRTWFFPRQPAVFLGGATFVPREPVAYLTHLYGYIGADAVRDSRTGYFKPRQSGG